MSPRQAVHEGVHPGLCLGLLAIVDGDAGGFGFGMEAFADREIFRGDQRILEAGGTIGAVPYAVGSAPFEAVRAGKRQLVETQVTGKIVERPAADDRHPAIEAADQVHQQVTKRLPDVDAVRSRGKIDQGPVEIEEQGGIVEEVGGRKRKAGHALYRLAGSRAFSTPPMKERTPAGFVERPTRPRGPWSPGWRVDLRIAQIAPLAEAVPPKLYGGTERVIWWLTEALVELGHDVTLYASADSDTSAKLVPCAPQALRLAGINDHLASTLAMVDRVLGEADRYDILHFHVDFVHFPLFRHMADRCFTTLHGRLDLVDFLPAFTAFPEMQLVSISDDQRRPVPDANFVQTVHHGLPENLIPFSPVGGDYLAFLGRISPEKRPDRAIEIAKRSGMKLKMAAKVDHADARYYEERIAPLIDDPLIEFIGEIGDHQKAEFLGRAQAMLFPIDWPEPFGLVMIEAMAAGTPTIAWKAGSTVEVIDHGRSGYLVESVDEAVKAVRQSAGLTRSGVRRCFEDRFTARRMAQDYLRLFEATITKDQAESRGPFLLAG